MMMCIMWGTTKFCPFVLLWAVIDVLLEDEVDKRLEKLDFRGRANMALHNCGNGRESEQNGSTDVGKLHALEWYWAERGQ